MTNSTTCANLCGLNRKDFQTTVNGKKTDLKIDKPVYAIHFKLERENLENDRT